MSEIKTISLPEFTTESGAVFTNLNVHYHVFGQDYQTAPVVLVNHSLTGDSIVTGEKGWWSDIIGSGLTIDTDYYSIIAFNIPGNGTNGDCIERHTDFHTGDIAVIFYKALRQLGIESLYAIIGGSIGGGIAWEMAANYPNYSQYLIPIAADWKASDWIIANTFFQKRILQNSSDPLRDARIHAMLTYRTPISFGRRFERTTNKDLGIFNVESWLLHHGNKLNDRFELQAYIMMNHLLATIDIGRGEKNSNELIQNINAEIHLIAVDSDLFFTPEEDRKTFAQIKPLKENIFYHEIQSIHGHDAFLIEHKSVAAILKNIFIKS